MRYVAMDFETGNGDYISACSIGLSYYEDMQFLGSESFFIQPPDCVGKFHWYNVKIHGIKRAQLKNEPTFDQIWQKIKDKIEGSVLVCHNAVFDTEVLCRCLEFYHLPLPTCQYICTVKVSKKVWPNLENHKLNTVSEALGIELNHHEAGSDAHACGEILQCALRQTNCADAAALAKKIGLQLGHISPDERRSSLTSKKAPAKVHSHSKNHAKQMAANSPLPQQRKEGV